jgi:c-di-GMP-binding flagellar brake protein YcgR
MIDVEPRPAQRRRGFRADVAFQVEFTNGPVAAGEATALDISAFGLRIFGEKALQVGQTVELRFALPEAAVRKGLAKLTRKPSALTFDALSLRAEVRTGKYDDDRCAHVHGLVFVAPPETVREAIHQFVHLTQIARA